MVTLVRQGELPAKAGTVVPVYLKSNISKSYVDRPCRRTRRKPRFPSVARVLLIQGRAEKRAQQFCSPNAPCTFRRGATAFPSGQGERERPAGVTASDSASP